MCRYVLHISDVERWADRNQMVATYPRYLHTVPTHLRGLFFPTRLWLCVSFFNGETEFHEGPASETGFHEGPASETGFHERPLRETGEAQRQTFKKLNTIQPD